LDMEEVRKVSGLKGHQRATRIITGPG
jgi:hypothetical protein